MHKFDCVVMMLSGHRHRETYFRDERDIHHVSLAAALETPPDQASTVFFFGYLDYIISNGIRTIQSTSIYFYRQAVGM